MSPTARSPLAQLRHRTRLNAIVAAAAAGAALQDVLVRLQAHAEAAAADHRQRAWDAGHRQREAADAIATANAWGGMAADLAEIVAGTCGTPPGAAVTLPHEGQVR